MEAAKPVKNASSFLEFSGHSEFETGLLVITSMIFIYFPKTTLLALFAFSLVLQNKLSFVKHATISFFGLKISVADKFYS